jgi:flagellum-specific peptidoglycan hydrolase FlgJ
MTGEQKQWLEQTSLAAVEGWHIFPNMAACEAAEESNYGKSTLARDGNNLFGLKSRAHPVYGTLSIPTREYLDGNWEIVEALWVKYPDTKSCFEDRMTTLKRLAAFYPHYEEALQAPGPFEYVIAVSKTWSTDPERAVKVISIYNEWFSPSSTEADSLHT